MHLSKTPGSQGDAAQGWVGGRVGRGDAAVEPPTDEFTASPAYPTRSGALAKCV